MENNVCKENLDLKNENQTADYESIELGDLLKQKNRWFYLIYVVIIVVMFKVPLLALTFVLLSFIYYNTKSFKNNSAISYIKQDKFVKAEKTLESLIEKGKDDDRTDALMSYIQYKKGNFKESEKYAKMAKNKGSENEFINYIVNNNPANKYRVIKTVAENISDEDIKSIFEELNRDKMLYEGYSNKEIKEMLNENEKIWETDMQSFLKGEIRKEAGILKVYWNNKSLGELPEKTAAAMDKNKGRIIECRIYPEGGEYKYWQYEKKNKRIEKGFEDRKLRFEIICSK